MGGKRQVKFVLINEQRLSSEEDRDHSEKGPLTHRSRADAEGIWCGKREESARGK